MTVRRKKPQPPEDDLEDLLEDAKNAHDAADEFRRRLQRVVIQRLIEKFGGVRKAAEATGQSPGNFANLKGGRRWAQLELLERLAEPLLEDGN